MLFCRLWEPMSARFRIVLRSCQHCAQEGGCRDGGRGAARRKIRCSDFLFRHNFWIVRNL
jgi:hypothetical protein